MGTLGDAPDRFRDPWGLALTPDQTCLVVADTANRRLVLLDVTDGRVKSTLTPELGVFLFPRAVIAVPHTEQVLVTDCGWNQVILLGLTDAAVVRVFGEGYGRGDRHFHQPFGVALVEAADMELAANPTAAASAAAGQDATLVAVADLGNHRVVLYRLADAAFVRCFGSKGAAPGQFDSPHSVVSVPSSCIPNSGSSWLAIADSNHLRVQLMTLTGEVVRVLAGDAVNGLGPLSNMLCGIFVCIDEQGNPELLVADSGHQRVVALRLDGSAARVVCGTGEAGSRAGQLFSPAGLAVTAVGDLWVVDRGNHRLSWFR